MTGLTNCGRVLYLNGYVWAAYSAKSNNRPPTTLIFQWVSNRVERAPRVSNHKIVEYHRTSKVPSSATGNKSASSEVRREVRSLSAPASSATSADCCASYQTSARICRRRTLICYAAGLCIRYSLPPSRGNTNPNQTSRYTLPHPPPASSVRLLCSPPLATAFALLRASIAPRHAHLAGLSPLVPTPPFDLPISPLSPPPPIPRHEPPQSSSACSKTALRRPLYRRPCP